MGRVMESGSPREAACHEAGTPFSLSIVSRDMARTRDETPMIAKIKKDTQAVAREIIHRRCLRSFWVVFINN